MATAAEPPDPSGKTGGFESNTECDLCGSTTPVKYCQECQFTLCQICSKGHAKIQSTKDHVLLDIGLSKSRTSHAKSGDAELGPTSCIKHPRSTLDLYCEQCKVLICHECRPHHKNHTVLSIKDDLQMYQHVCTEHIKSLLDKARDLEEYKTLVKGVFESYDDAIQTVKKWEKELIQLVKDSSRSLQEDLEKAKKEVEGVVNDPGISLSKTATNVDDKLSKLHSIRKVTDADIFSQELASSQQLLETVTHFIESILPELTVPTVTDILPNMSQMQRVRTGIMDLMTSDTRASTWRKYPLPNIESPCQKLKLDIPYPNSRQGYRIFKSCTGKKQIMIHGTRWKDIRLLHLENNRLEQFTSNCEIYNMISTGKNEYVAIGFEEKNMYFLNSKFEITKTRVTNKACRGVSDLIDNTFLLLEVEEKSSQHIAHISVWKRNGNDFIFSKETSFEVAEKIKRLVTNENKTYVFLHGDKHLYKIKLEDWTIQTIDMSRCMKYVWSLCVVGDSILVGDDTGRIHKFNTQLQYEKVILDISNAVGIQDIAVTNGYLVITSENNKIFLYK